MNSFTVVFSEHFTSPEDKPNVLQQDFADVLIKFQHMLIDMVGSEPVIHLVKCLNASCIV